MLEKNNDQKQYDQWWTNFVSTNVEDPGTAFRTDFIVNKIKKLKTLNIADVGCGSGQLIKKILSHTKNLKLTGFDVSQKIIEFNRNNLKGSDFFCLNLNEESSIDKKFDMVICCEVIEHLREWQKAIKTLSKLVDNNSYILITTQSGKIYKHHKALEHLKHFKKEEIEKELMKNGIKIIESSYAGWPFMNLKNILANLFFKNIENSLLRSKNQSSINKLVFKIFGLLYKISSKKYGPQIIILGKK